jgi:hypothetical protein
VENKTRGIANYCSFSIGHEEKQQKTTQTRPPFNILIFRNQLNSKGMTQLSDF